MNIANRVQFWTSPFIDLVSEMCSIPNPLIDLDEMDNTDTEECTKEEGEIVSETKTGSEKQSTNSSNDAAAVYKKKFTQKDRVLRALEICKQTKVDIFKKEGIPMKLSELDKLHEMMINPDVTYRCKAAYILPLMIFLKKVKLIYNYCYEAGNGACYISTQEGREFVEELKEHLPTYVYRKNVKNYGRPWWKISAKDFPKAQNALGTGCVSESEVAVPKAYIILSSYTVIDFDDPKPNEEKRCIIPYFYFESWHNEELTCDKEEPIKKKRKRTKK